MLKKIKDDLKIAIKNKDVKKELLRVLIGEINTVQGRSTTELTDSDIIKIIKKMVNNAKLIMANHEVKILEEYLPKMMSNDEIDKAIADIISVNGYSSMADMGKIMGALKSQYSGLYDGKYASTSVKNALSK